MKKTWGKAGSKPMQKQADVQKESVSLKKAEPGKPATVEQTKLETPSLKPTPSKEPEAEPSREPVKLKPVPAKPVEEKVSENIHH